jgi:hypothetical protein
LLLINSWPTKNVRTVNGVMYVQLLCTYNKKYVRCRPGISEGVWGARSVGSFTRAVRPPTNCIDPSQRSTDSHNTSNGRCRKYSRK